MALCMEAGGEVAFGTFVEEGVQSQSRSFGGKLLLDSLVVRD